MTTASRQLQVQQFLLPKAGALVEECEDAIGVNLAAGRIALADGATEAFDARSWAQRLAAGWVACEPAPLTRETFTAWAIEQGNALHDAWAGRTLAWYAEEKARRGSFAAFVGVQFALDSAAPCWQTFTLGDSCVLQQHNGAISYALPIADPQLFTSTPVLVPSRGQLHEYAFAQAQVACNGFAPDDVLWLLTDAVAEWFLKRAAVQDEVIERLARLLMADRSDALAELFQAERRARRMKDDDVAIVRVTLTAD